MTSGRKTYIAEPAKPTDSFPVCPRPVRRVSAIAASRSARSARDRWSKTSPAPVNRSGSGAPLEQRNAKLFLELLDLLTKRGLSYVQSFAGARKAQLLADRHEVTKMAQFHAAAYQRVAPHDNGVRRVFVYSLLRTRPMQIAPDCTRSVDSSRIASIMFIRPHSARATHRRRRVSHALQCPGFPRERSDLHQQNRDYSWSNTRQAGPTSQAESEGRVAPTESE